MYIISPSKQKQKENEKDIVSILVSVLSLVSVVVINQSPTDQIPIDYFWLNKPVLSDSDKFRWKGLLVILDVFVEPSELLELPDRKHHQENYDQKRRIHSPSNQSSILPTWNSIFKTKQIT